MTTMTTMTTLPLTPVDPDNLTVYANPNDLRRDLHTFVGYVSRRSIKRSYRGNELPQADYKRLAQVIHEGGPGSAEESGDQDALYGHGAEAPSWIDYLDRLALKMGFVRYDIKGTYRGYSSQEPSFPDNFMSFNADAYRTFLALPLAEQERRLVDTLVRDYSYSHNEFYRVSVHGRLDRFPNWGCGVGVMRGLNFAAIRRFLFDLLQGCEPGTWYSTSDLVAYLKAHHPFFLIPEKLEMNKQSKTVEKRYGNFYESNSLYSRDPIPDNAPDGFERVEGRYVERFLEGLPLTLGYVDV